MEEKYIKEYYEKYDEDGRLLKKDQQLEFITTTHYVEKYLQKESRILEVGAGTGRYSIYFSRKGYQVDAVELVQHNIDILKSKLKDNDNLSVQKGNALDLFMYEDNTFDVTLVLGPMYHMYNDQDRHTCIKEAVRVTKPNGIVCFAYITHDAVMVHWGLIGRNLLVARDNKMFTEQYECISEPKDLFSMFHVKQFNDLVSKYSLKHLHTVATDGVAPLFEEIFEKMSKEEIEEWTKYHLATCEREDLLGYSSHILYMGRKEEDL